MPVVGRINFDFDFDFDFESQRGVESFVALLRPTRVLQAPEGGRGGL